MKLTRREESIYSDGIKLGQERESARRGRIHDDGARAFVEWIVGQRGLSKVIRKRAMKVLEPKECYAGQK